MTCGYVVLNDTTVYKSEFKYMWKEAVAAYFIVLS